MELLRPCEYARRHGLDQKLVQARLAEGRLPFVRVHPGRGGRRIPSNARLSYKGATQVRRHAQGGLLCTAGGPGRLRRVSLREREQDRARHRVECACETCLQLVAAAREDTWRQAMAVIAEDRRESEDERWDEDACGGKFAAV